MYMKRCDMYDINQYNQFMIEKKRVCKSMNMCQPIGKQNKYLNIITTFSDY